MKSIIPLILLCLHVITLQAQNFTFAHVTDTHIGGKTSSEDLQKTIDDINSIPNIDFVLFTGDITEFGSDNELEEAKKLIDQLNKPWYIVPGNHDSKWSESGCNSFVRIFGSESFCFEHEGILFIGTASGPNMRMGPGLVPREQVVFLDSILTNMRNPDQPIIFVNHYPLDESLSNSSLIVNKLKTRNIKATLLGHGHINKLYNFNGIPGIMGRSNLRAKKTYGGYNLVNIKNDTIYYNERTPDIETLPAWCKIPLNQKIANQDTTPVSIGDSINKRYPDVEVCWELQDNSDIGSGLAAEGDFAVYSNTLGEITALSVKTGKIIWKFKTNGKIFSTPVIKKDKVICPSTDGNIYCLTLDTGELLWKFETSKSIVASPVIKGNTVFLGASDGIFRAIDLNTGKLNWQYSHIDNFVETRPVIYKNAVYFGSWGNTFYALNKKNGKLLWKREKYENRMYSPAAVWPVAAKGKVFIVAPDRHMSAIDSKTGKDVWESGEYSCRESIGISKNKKYVYIKNMFEGNVDAFYTSSQKQTLAWECDAQLGYEISPSPISETSKIVFVPTASGVVVAVNKKTHMLEWKYKISDALINYILPVGKNQVLVSSFDGKFKCLKY